MALQYDPSGKLKVPTAEQLAAADSNSAVIVLDRGTLQNGTPYWAFVAVKPSKYQAFMQVTKARQAMKLGDYGTILKYGYEASIPAAIMAEMKAAHGFDENYLAILSQKVKAEQGIFLKQQEAARINDIVAMLQKQKKS